MGQPGDHHRGGAIGQGLSGGVPGAGAGERWPGSHPGGQRVFHVFPGRGGGGQELVRPCGNGAGFGGSVASGGEVVDAERKVAGQSRGGQAGRGCRGGRGAGEAGVAGQAGAAGELGVARHVGEPRVGTRAPTAVGPHSLEMEPPVEWVLSGEKGHEGERGILLVGAQPFVAEVLSFLTGRSQHGSMINDSYANDSPGGGGPGDAR
ncbi:protein of unknown function [Kyrpidia spormannii]|uniref:Uncharacterized protein n=1 Tax=Kyrpidia spormannii TaxID=2055160 RepID=A0ACA8ZCU2_9BACL|nr:protein of unknown function [Kyrpidia spormannii]